MIEMFKRLKYKKDFSKMKNYFDNNDFENAIKYADLILDYDENNVEVLKYEYNALSSLKRYEDALICVDKILDLNPSGLALVNKGTTLCFLEEYEKGFEILDDVIKNYSEYEVAFLNKGHFLYDMARFDELLELSNWVLELYPDCSNAYDIKSLVYIKKGDFKSALEFNEYALYYDSENSVAKERKEHILKKLAEE